MRASTGGCGTAKQPHTHLVTIQAGQLAAADDFAPSEAKTSFPPICLNMTSLLTWQLNPLDLPVFDVPEVGARDIELGAGRMDHVAAPVERPGEGALDRQFGGDDIAHDMEPLELAVDVGSHRGQRDDRVTQVLAAEARRAGGVEHAVVVMPRVRPRPVVASGMLAQVGATVWLAQFGPHTGYAPGRWRGRARRPPHRPRRPRHKPRRARPSGMIPRFPIEVPDQSGRSDDLPPERRTLIPQHPRR